MKPRLDFYAAAHPGPKDVLLLVEVADTSAGYDQRVKLPLYARAGIPEVWLVDLEGDRIEVLREPAAGRYRSVRVYRRGDRLTPDVASAPRPEAADPQTVPGGIAAPGSLPR